MLPRTKRGVQSNLDSCYSCRPRTREDHGGDTERRAVVMSATRDSGFLSLHRNPLEARLQTVQRLLRYAWALQLYSWIRNVQRLTLVECFDRQKGVRGREDLSVPGMVLLRSNRPYRSSCQLCDTRSTQGRKSTIPVRMRGEESQSAGASGCFGWFVEVSRQNSRPGIGGCDAEG